MRVFISYRRGDSAGHAGRLRDSLERSLGADHVFQDVTSLAAGDRFAAALTESIAAADAVLVVIGRHWVDAADEAGGRRLDDPDDVVRLEVETALSTGRRTVPVLVDGAVLPDGRALPPSLAPLLDVHAVELHDASWSSDVDRLVRSLRPPPRSRRTLGLAAAAAAAVAVAVLAIVLWPHDPGGGDDDDGTAPSSSADGSTCPTTPTGEAQPAPAEPVGIGRISDVEVTEWYRRPAGDGRQEINVDLTVTGRNADGVSLEENNFNAKVDGFQQPAGSFCYTVLSGQPILGDGDRVRLLVSGTLDDGAPVEINLGGYGDDNGAIVVLGP